MLLTCQHVFIVHNSSIPSFKFRIIIYKRDCDPKYVFQRSSHSNDRLGQLQSRGIRSKFEALIQLWKKSLASSNSGFFLMKIQIYSFMTIWILITCNFQHYHFILPCKLIRVTCNQTIHIWINLHEHVTTLIFVSKGGFFCNWYFSTGNTPFINWQFGLW